MQAEAVTAINFDARPAIAGAAQVEAAGERIIRTEQGIVTATERVLKAQADTAAAYARLERQLDPLARQQQALERGMNLVNRQLDLGRITGDRHAQMLGLLNQRYGQVKAAADAMVPAITRVAAANDVAAKSSGRFGAAIQQVGYQATDVATQVLAGGDAFKAFAMQAGQLLGFFGPGGVVAGAALTIGAVVWQVLSLKDSTREAAEAAKLHSTAVEKSNELLMTSKELARQAAERKRDEAIEAVKLAQSLEILRLARLKEALAANEAEAARMRDEQRLLPGTATMNFRGDVLTRLQKEIEDVNRSIADMATRLGKLNNGSDVMSLPGFAKETDEATAAQDRLRRAIQLVKFAVQDAERYLQPYEEAMKRMESAAKGGRDPYAEFLETIKQLNADLAVLTRDGLNPRAWELYAAAVAKANFELQKNTVIADADTRFDAAKRAIMLDIADFEDFVKGPLAQEAKRFSQLAQEAIVSGSLDASSILRAGVAAGMGEALEDFYKDFRTQMEDLIPGIGKSFAEALASNAVANIIGNLMGRSEAQNRNAQIGGAVGATAGHFLPGGSKVWSFIGNIVGGLFGPGKSDATAGADIYARTDQVVNFDTSPSKQDAGNMSARDALSDSVLRYTALLESIGGQLARQVSLEVGSRDGNRWRVYGQDGALASSGVTAVGDIQGTLSQVLAAITNTLTGVPDEIASRLRQVDFSDLARAEADVNFILTYKDALSALNGTLEGGSDAVKAARDGVRAQIEYVRDFGDQARRLGYDVDQTSAALRVHVERFAGLRDAAPVLTEVETRVQALRAGFEDLAPLLIQVGYGAEEAASALAAAEQKQMAALRADVSRRQDAAYNDLIGNGYINDIRDLIGQRDTDIRDALAVGLSDAGALRNFNAALAGVLTTDLRADQLQEAIRLFGDIPGVTEAANAALADLGDGVRDVAAAARSAADIAMERDGLERRLLELQGDTAELRRRERLALDDSNRALYDQIKTLEDQRDAAAEAARALDEAAQAMERIRGQGASIRGWIDQARSGGIDGFLSPQQQLANASADFYKQLALAAANDNDALSSITGYADRYAKAQQAVAGSGGQTQSVIAGILGSLEALPAVKSFDAQQIDLLTEIAANTDVAAKRLLAADLNGDTRITWPEFTAWAGQNVTDTRRIAQILGVQSNSLEDIFKAIDLNGDGVIDAVERSRLGVAEAIYGLPTKTATQIGLALSPYFATLDRNLDGLLTPDEFRGGLVGLASDANITAWFKELDANGDGVLSATELTRRAVIDLGTGAGEGSLLAIGRLIYGGNVDRLNLVHATNLGLVTLGALIDASNTYLMAIRDKSWAVTVAGGGASAPSLPPAQIAYNGGYDAERDARYLAANSDVVPYVLRGTFGTGYDHYSLYGRMEGRSYAVGTDFHPGGPALVHANELLIPSMPRGTQVLTARQTAELLRPVNVNVRSGGSNDNAAALREVAASVRRLEQKILDIARAQASQQDGEMSGQTKILSVIARNTTPRRVMME